MNGSATPSDVQPLTEASLEEHNASNGTKIEPKGPEDDKSSSYLHSDNVVNGEKDPDSKSDSDESQDSVDRPIGWNEGYQGAPDEGLDNSANTRYEIRHWFTHVRKAESLWPNKEERDSSKEWSILLEELDRFVTNERIFNAWLGGYIPDVVDWKPIHVAANFGLTSLTEHLLSKGTDISSLSGERFTPLHLAVNPDNRFEMMQLLLKHDAQPNFDAYKEIIPPFHYWILCGATGEEIQGLLNHGASLSLKNMFGLNVMHYFAWVGSKPEDLFLLLDHKGENNDVADINVTDDIGETPLHKLLSRRDIPLKLLQAFVDRGADVNIDDKDSQSKS